MSRTALEAALLGCERTYGQVIDRLRELAPPQAENEVHELTVKFREAVAIIGCARRLTRGRTLREIHDAFGAPGDFGYDTPLGEALSDIYHGKATP